MRMNLISCHSAIESMALIKWTFSCCKGTYLSSLRDSLTWNPNSTNKVTKITKKYQHLAANGQTQSAWANILEQYAYVIGVLTLQV